MIFNNTAKISDREIKRRYRGPDYLDLVKLRIRRHGLKVVTDPLLVPIHERLEARLARKKWKEERPVRAAQRKAWKAERAEARKAEAKAKAKAKAEKKKSKPAPGLEKMHNLSDVRDSLLFKSNRSLKEVCKRLRIPILNVSRQTKLIRHSDYELLLQRLAKSKSR